MFYLISLTPRVGVSQLLIEFHQRLDGSAGLEMTRLAIKSILDAGFECFYRSPRAFEYCFATGQSDWMSISVSSDSRYAPKGRFRLASFFLKLASTSSATPSIYGPSLQSKWHDLTFRFCVTGYYGHYFSDFLRTISYSYSFVDIGANYGIYSLVAAGNSHCKNCYAFEPNANVFEALKTNAKLNDATQIQAFNFAISDRTGLLPFAASETHSGARRALHGRHSGHVVPTRDKEFFDKIEFVDKLPKVVKIDVEGMSPSLFMN